MSPSVTPTVDPDRGMRPLLTYFAGAVLGGTTGAAVVVVVTTIIKESLAVTSRQEPWLLLTLPVIGVALSTFVLNVIGHGEPVQWLVPPHEAPADPPGPAVGTSNGLACCRRSPGCRHDHAGRRRRLRRRLRPLSGDR